MSLFSDHMQRLRAGASQAVAIKETSRWISENTFIGGKPYSYKDHEYQQRILDSEARELVVRKCSQVGISELAVRKALALCGLIKNFVVIYTLPTASFAGTLSKTRVNPVINESPFLRRMVSDLDNVEVKQIGSSYLYIRGASDSSATAPLSIPAHCLVHDELDASSASVIGAYQSRLTHSPYKMKFKLSTPTLPGKGIDAEFQRSKRHFLFVKCSCCGHQFVPSYYDHVRIPGSTMELMSIDKRTLNHADYMQAYVECPRCGGKPSLQPEYREWVCENPDEIYLAEGFQVSPFDAPNIISPGYLVEASTQYANIADFYNNNLGVPYYSQEAALSPAEIEACITKNRFDYSQCVMGLDLGKQNHIVVAATHWDGSMQIIHTEVVPLQLLKERYRELRLKYRVRVTVADSLPYTDMILALQSEDPNMWACVYSEFKGVELFKTKMQEEKDERGLQTLRQINVARNRTFDSLMSFIRSGQFSKFSDENDDEFVRHCTDMVRTKDWDTRSQQMQFKWQKSPEGADHWFFSSSYAYLASKIIRTSTGSSIILPLVSTFRVKQR